MTVPERSKASRRGRPTPNDYWRRLADEAVASWWAERGRTADVPRWRPGERLAQVMAHKRLDRAVGHLTNVVKDQ